MEQSTKYTRIPIGAVEALAGHQNSNFAIYLPGQSDQKPTLYRGPTDQLSRPDFDRLTDAGLTHLFICTTDNTQCATILEDKLSDVLQQSDMTNDEKTDLVYHIGTHIAQDLTSVSNPTQEIDRASQVIDNVISFVLSDPQVANNMLCMASHEQSTASHMFVVSTLAILLGTEIYGPDAAVLKSLGLAGMMHDIGKLKISQDILNKSSPLTPAETLLIQQHPIESVRLLGDNPQITPEIKQIIVQHHERVDGRGYPLGVSGDKLHQDSRLLTIVDTFHAMIGKRSYRKPMTPVETIRMMNTLGGKQFDPEILAIWSTLVNRFLDAGIKHIVEQDTQGDQSDNGYRHEHRATSPPPITFDQRAKRYDCNSNVKVQCVYSGRLMNMDVSPDNFVASVHNISQAGLCIHSAYPMYRGEVIHVKISDIKSEFWVRGSIAWCKPHDICSFRIGVQFLDRISEEEAFEKVTVRCIEDYQTSKTKSNPKQPPSQAKSTKLSQEEEQISNEPKTPIEILESISKKKSVSLEEERTVITLVSSKDVNVRDATIEILIKMGYKPARVPIIELLSDAEPIIREHAAMAAGELKMHDADHILRKLLKDHSKTVTLRAAGALSKLDDDCGKSIVIDYLNSDGPLTRLAAHVFGEIVGHRFAANTEGIQAARRYLKAKKKYPALK